MAVVCCCIYSSCIRSSASRLYMYCLTLQSWKYFYSSCPCLCTRQPPIDTGMAYRVRIITNPVC